MSKSEKYTLIVGMGKVGKAVAKFLKKQGKNIVITDRDISKKPDGDIFENQGIKTEIGFHNLKTFENAGLIIVSPGVPLDIAELKKARKKGIKITGELDTISEMIDIPIVAVTGTNGKTTTTILLGDMLKESGFNVFVCGNIGTPIVDYLSFQNADILVAEISSFQLDTSDKFKPDVAVLLNIAEDHLDRYDSYDDYVLSKWSIFKNQTEEQIAIVNAKIDNCDAASATINSKISYYNKDNNNSVSYLSIADSKIDLGSTKLKGAHNKENIAAAILATLASKGNMEGVYKALKNFTPPAHRLEFVKSINQVDFYNDSKATNPDAVKRAIECFDNRVLLIMGGLEKGTDFIPLKKTLKTKIKTLFVMGEAKDKIIKAFSDVCKIVHAVSMEDAVKLAYATSAKGDIVLLSPGCASFDMYSSYSQRGDDFKKQVERLEN